MENSDTIHGQCLKVPSNALFTGDGTSDNPYVLRPGTTYRFPSGAHIVVYRSVVSGKNLVVHAYEAVLNVDSSDVHGESVLVVGNRNTGTATPCIVVGRQNLLEDARQFYQTDATVVHVGLLNSRLGPGDGEWRDATACTLDGLMPREGVMQFAFCRKHAREDNYEHLTTSTGTVRRTPIPLPLRPRRRVATSKQTTEILSDRAAKLDELNKKLREDAQKKRLRASLNVPPSPGVQSTRLYEKQPL